jgi:soluble lytic murein transglycosylase-like protein
MSLGIAPVAPDAGIAERMARINALIAAVETGDPSAANPSTDFATQLSSATTTGLASTRTNAVRPPTSAPADVGSFGAEIEAAAARHGIDPALLKGLIRQESGFDPAARSGAGAVGLTQLMPGTAASLGVTDPTDPAQSIEGGAAYLAQQLQRFGGDPAKALAAYNAGPGAVAKYGGVPPYAETQQYVQKVLGYAAQYGMGQAAAATVPAALPSALTSASAVPAALAATGTASTAALAALTAPVTT